MIKHLVGFWTILATIAVVQALAAESTLPFHIKWETRVGLTTFKTTIHYISGAVVLGSQGIAKDAPNDNADGVYFLDGRNGNILRHIHWSDYADLDVNGIGLGPRTLFFGNDHAEIFAYGIYGQDSPRLWKKTLSGNIKGAPGVEDFNSDGTYDAVFGTESGDVVAVDGKNGATIWQVAFPFKPVFTVPKERAVIASPALVDLNRDGVRDIVIGCRNGSVYALNGKSGEIMWEYRTRTPSGVHGSAVVDGDRIIVAESYSTISWLDFRGQAVRVVRLAEDPEVQGLFSSPAVFPNGAVVIGSSWASGVSGIWYIPSSDSKPVFFPAGRVSATSAIADVLGKGTPQAIIPTEKGELWVISESGQKLGVFSLNSGTETSPLIADIDNDGRLDIVVSGADRMIRAYSTPGTRPAEWATFRGNRHNTGVVDDRLDYYPKIRPGLIQLQKTHVTSPNLYTQKEAVYETTGYHSEDTLISPDGIGIARLGTTWGRLKRALGGDTEFIHGRFGAGLKGVSVVQDNEEQFVVLFPDWQGPSDNDTVAILMTYNRKFRTKEGVGPGTPISVAAKIYGSSSLFWDTDRRQESVAFKSPPWDKIRFGIIPVTGEYSGQGVIRTTSKFPEGSFIHYIEVRK
ncbi:hypothetical protein EBR96_04685 [bacterium]|nr:hypothetical protein [bacterium]